MSMPRILYYVFGPIEHGNRVAIGTADVDGVRADVHLFDPIPEQASRDDVEKFARMSDAKKLHALSGGRFMLGPAVPELLQDIELTARNPKKP